MDKRETLISIYRAFNARDIDSVLSAMHLDVTWPNGWEGGVLHGQTAVREYWIRQWAEINPHVDPIEFSTDTAGRVTVEVHQVVHDLVGNLIADVMVQHVYTFVDELIKSMEINHKS